MQMTAQQKNEYATYRKACKLAGVWPTRADFLAGDIPTCVKREMEYGQPQLARGAAAGH